MEQSRIFHFVLRMKFYHTPVKHMMMLVLSAKVDGSEYSSSLSSFHVFSTQSQMFQPNNLHALMVM